MIEKVEIEPYLDVFLVKEIDSGKQVASCHDKQDACDIQECIDFYIKKNSSKDGEQISIKWHISDVIDRARALHFNITLQQAKEILAYMKYHHDAKVGINWDVIDCQLEMLGT